MEAGKFFSKKLEWTKHLDTVGGNGGHIPDFLHKAVKSGKIDPFDARYTNHKRKNLRFRGKNFLNFEALKAHQFPNSSSIYAYAGEVKKEIARMRNMGALREISKEQAHSDDSCINPLQWERQHRANGKIKCRLILHSKANTLYTRPRFSMADIGVECHNISRFESLVKVDECDAFYQFGVTDKAAKSLRCVLDLPGSKPIYLEFTVLTMGLASSPYLVHLSNRFLVESYVISTGLYGECFLDDIWTEERRGVLHFDQFCEDLDIYFKGEKKEVGAQLTLLGIEIKVWVCSVASGDPKYFLTQVASPLEKIPPPS